MRMRRRGKGERGERGRGMREEDTPRYNQKDRETGREGDKVVFG